MSHQGLFGLPNPFVTVKGLPGSIFDSSPSQLSLTIYESTGLWGLTNPFVTSEMSSRPTSEGAATHFSLTF